MFLTEINIFPIKSLAGISVTNASVAPKGLQYDRRWMLVDAEGRFQSQREFPQMALFGTAIVGDMLQVFSRKNLNEQISIPLEVEADSLPLIGVNVWDDDFSAPLMPDRIGEWFSDQLGKKLRLVYMSDAVVRPTDPKYAAGHQVSFADGYPFLLIGQASLDDLNARLEQSVPMNRFRPNFVFTGGVPYEEDTFSDVQIGNALFQGVKACGRCIMTTTDQESGKLSAEPLKTLATYRAFGKKINFGENLVWKDANGAAMDIKVGDAVKVLSRK